MAKLYFKYGTMKSGKSLDLIRTYDTYIRQGKRVLVIKPDVDTRTEGTISSRMGGEIKAAVVRKGRGQTNTLDTVLSNTLLHNDLDVILVDEAQFLDAEQVAILVDAVDKRDIPVVAYGLKNTFDNKLFEGTQQLLIYSDKIEEIKSICENCNSKATMNFRETGGTGEIQIGDGEYRAMCRTCYDYALQLQKEDVK